MYYWNRRKSAGPVEASKSDFNLSASLVFCCVVKNETVYRFFCSLDLREEKTS